MSEKDDRIEALLRATGRRPGVPADRANRVEASVRAHWRSETRGRSRRRRIGAAVTLALAATVLVAVVVATRRRGEPLPAPPPELAARVERVVASDAGSPALRPGDEILAGSELATEAEALLAVRMETGYSLRLDAGTRLRVLASDVVALDRGAVYVDSRGTRPGALTIRTPLGDVHDVGTQFEARLQPASLRLRVREGSVVLDRAGSRVEVSSGQELELAGDGRTSRRALDAFGPEWTWIAGITPMMRLDGRTLREFLDWMARERGLALEFSSPVAAGSATSIELEGSIEGMTLDEALESVLSTCRMTHRIEGNTLFVDPAD